MPVRARGLLVTGSVVAALAASGGTVLTLPDRLAGGEASPAVTPSAHTQPSAPAPDRIGPPVTGAQIAATALAPARERAAVMAANRARQEEERRAAASATENPHSANGQGDHFRNMSPRLQEYVRKACAEGRMRAEICRNV